MTKITTYFKLGLYLALFIFTTNTSLALSPIPEAISNLRVHDTPKPRVEASFFTPEGDDITLTRFQGKPIVLNFWATWCAPCVKEMPHLSDLAYMLQEDLKVLTVATGRNTKAAMERFFRQTKITNLPNYNDPSQEFARAFGVIGLPVTVILNAQGEEMARLTGEAKWNDPQVLAWLRDFTGKPSN